MSRLRPLGRASRGLRAYSGLTKPRPPDEDEFRVLSFTAKRDKLQRKEAKRFPVPPPRAEQMRVDQKWSWVWPGARSFHPACVPLPLRQGYVPLGSAPPPATSNHELMKIPNFLHLTPPAVAAHCAALAPFCTPWPPGLDDDRIAEAFPLEVITSDYCHSGPSVRNPLSRIVSVRIKLSKIPLDEHARDKLFRIVGERYDEQTDYLTIVTDRCPTRKQNLDYANYLLTAIFHEAWNTEDWEADKKEDDMEVYVWSRNASKAALVEYVSFGSAASTELDERRIPGIDEYEEAVSEMMNIGENDYQMHKYKNAVLKVFGISKDDGLKIDSLNRASVV